MTTIHYAIHPEDREVMVGMREQVAPMKGSITGPEARPLFDSMMLHVAAAPGVTYETATVGGVDGSWCRPVDAADASAAILYFHGGAYVIGSAQAYRNFVGQVVARTKTAAFVPQTGNSSPICAAAMSPWTDLALAGETMRSRAEADPRRQGVAESHHRVPRTSASGLSRHTSRLD